MQNVGRQGQVDKCPTCGRRRTRSTEQNSLMWALLTDISEQVDWYGQYLSPENWKDVFTAGLTRQKVVPGMDGGFVVCGTSTSKMTVSEMNELIELAMAFGSERGVRFKAAPAQISHS